MVHPVFKYMEQALEGKKTTLGDEETEGAESTFNREKTARDRTNMEMETEKGK